MANRLPLKDRLRDHPMFVANDYCDMCNEPVDPKRGLNECGNAMLCDACLERMREKVEADYEGDR